MEARRLIAMLIAMSLGGCSGSSDAEDGSTPSVRTDDPAATFAPLVELHGRERSYPVSAGYFLRSSGLEFVGTRCRFAELDIAAGPISRPVVGQPVPPLDARKLGREPSYRSRAVGTNCRYRSDVFTTTQRTRPYDRDDRPAGMDVDEGFSLDILTDQQPGERRIGPDGTLVGIPVYVHDNQELVEGRRGIRLSYWMLFGRGKENDPVSRRWVEHEGDWERVDVLLIAHGKGAATSYEPVSAEYRIADELRALVWDDVETDATGRHVLAYLAREVHTPYPSPAKEDEPARLAWKTWRRVRDVTREPWYGYGGGWGAIGETEAATGPLGPSPFELETSQRVTEAKLPLR